MPGLGDTEKEVLSLILSIKPQVTAQLARIGANIRPLMALPGFSGAASPQDLALLPSHILDQVGHTI